MEGISSGGGGSVAPPSQEDQERLIESFRAITSSLPSEAFFFLESHTWQLDAAIQSFFDAADPADLADTAPARISPPPAASSRRRRRHQLQEEDGDGGDEDEGDEDYVPPVDEGPQSRSPTRPTAAAMASSPPRDSRSSKPSGSRPAGGIRTLADLNQSSGYGSDEDSDGPQEYYTGGEKSGMLVQDPSKANPDVDAIFEQARQMGATEETPEYLDTFRPSSSFRSFTGTARRLTGETVQAALQPPESVVHDVIFWTNGFTVNDGPLRRFDDPENASFLESIKKSECPKELEPADRRTAVHVGLSRRDEKYPEPVKRYNPFTGVGRTLGAGASTATVPPVDAAATAPTSSSSAGLSVDDSLPSTSVQLRLADGTRMVARFNYHHTVGDIRSFIDASRPGATRNYQLQTVGFPPKQLTDVSQTIEEVGLANSVIIQRF
uniref:UBA and UBX domain-containing protein At4g15410 n=1 Tax=Anthurium amnicola TaxID=1678845 RepID=A0A1D1YZ14_9ARAE